METVLKHIAKQASLERVLFTPAMKKIYFSMAIGSGGLTQFKHAESIRKGLSYCADKADDKKRALLFCALSELVEGIGPMVKYAGDMLPMVVLANRAGIPESQQDRGSFLQFGSTGWIQFHTHTLQETYDHLALAYHLFEEHKIKLPVLVLFSGLHHECLGTYDLHKDLTMGNPLTGLQSERAGREKGGFEAAILSLKKKEQVKPSMQSCYDKLSEAMRSCYKDIGYTLPDEGMPYHGTVCDGDTAIVSMIPPHSGDRSDIIRPYCYRPFSLQGLVSQLAQKKAIAIVEPKAVPGALPVFLGEFRAALGSQFTGTLLSFILPSTQTTLNDAQIQKIDSTLTQAASDPQNTPHWNQL